MVGYGGLSILWPSELTKQCAKKIVSDSLGLVDFAIRLVIFVLNKCCFLGKSKLQKECTVFIHL